MNIIKQTLILILFSEDNKAAKGGIDKTTFLYLRLELKRHNFLAGISHYGIRVFFRVL